MYAEIEAIINKVLGEKESIYDYVETIEDTHMFVTSPMPNRDVLKDMLLDYYYGNQAREAVVQAICKHFKIDPLDIAEIVGAVDELRDKKDSTNV